MKSEQMPATVEPMQSGGANAPLPVMAGSPRVV
jgi:hypothetical protein